MALPEIRVNVETNADAAALKVKTFGSALGGIPKQATSASSGTAKLSNSFGRLGSVSRQTRARIQNVSFQLQDIAVQMQAGTRTSVVLAQQLPQLAGAFGAAGAVVGVLAGVGIPALAFAFSGLAGDSRELSEQIEDLEDRLDSYVEAASRADLNTGELADEFRRLTPEIVQAARALEDFAKRETQNEIDALTNSLSELLGVGGAGELRTNIADFFDVGIVFAFTDAQRESRKEARLLTAEFLNSQSALESAEGNLEAQSEALSRLLSATQKLAAANGDISDQENELIGQIAQALANTERFREEVDSAGNGLQVALDITNNLVASSELLADPIQRGANAAANLAQSLADALSTQAQILGQAAQRRGGGRGGDPRQFGFGAGDIAALIFGGGSFEADPETPDLNAGRAAANQRQDNLEALIESLQTEREVVEQFRDEGLELLRTASEAELEALGGFNEAKLRLEEEYQERLSRIKKEGAAADLATAFGAGQDVLSALGAFNSKALKIAQVFGAAQALISTYQGAAEALKLPYPQNLAAAASVISAGLGFVSSIKSVNASSGGSVSGGGGGSGAAVSDAGGGQPVRPLEVRVSGFGPDDLISGLDISNLFEMLQDEAGDRGLSVQFAT